MFVLWGGGGYEMRDLSMSTKFHIKLLCFNINILLKIYISLVVKKINYSYFYLQEDCMLRYKYLVELVKKKKEKEDAEADTNNSDLPTDVDKED